MADKSPKVTDDDIRKAEQQLHLGSMSLGIIEEGSEDEESDGDDIGAPVIQPLLFSASDVAQAFSHFSYWATGRKRPHGPDEESRSPLG